MSSFKYFSQPAEPSIFLNYYDLIFLIVLNVLFYLIYIRKKIKLDRIQKITWILLFFIVIPLVSIKIELIQIFNTFTVIDGFNLIYTYFRFPTWWIIGIVNYVILKIVIKNKSRFTEIFET